MNKRRFVILLVLLFAMTILPIFRAYAVEGDEKTNEEVPTEVGITDEKAEGTPEVLLTVLPNNEHNEDTADDSPVLPDDAEPENGKPDNDTQVDEELNTVKISPKVNRKFGIIFVSQEKEKWETTTEVYYNSSIWFVVLCLVIVIIDILVLIVGIYLINKIKR